MSKDVKKSRSFADDDEPHSLQDQKKEMEKVELKTRYRNESGVQASDSQSYLHSVRFNPSSYTPSDNSLYSGKVPPDDFSTYDPTPPYHESNPPPYHTMPLKDIGFESRRQLGCYLDIEFSSCVKNWKSLADELGFSYWQIKTLENQTCKTQELLNQYNAQKPQTTLGHLCKIIDSKLERHDIIADMNQYFEKDYERYRRPLFCGMLPTLPLPSQPPQSHMYHMQPQMMYSPSHHMQPRQHEIQTPEISSTQRSATLPTEPDTSNLSINKHYDGFVLYDKADKEFILTDFLPRLEEKAGIKLFIPERDMEGGLQAYGSRLNLMIQQCSKLVVILSDEFLRAEPWGLNLAVSIDPTARHQKIIPVIYKKITERNILSGINACDRTKVLHDEWFWKNLIRSLASGRSADNNHH